VFFKPLNPQQTEPENASKEQPTCSFVFEPNLSHKTNANQTPTPRRLNFAGGGVFSVWGCGGVEVEVALLLLLLLRRCC